MTTTERTVERPRVERAAPAEPERKHRSLMTAIAVIVALLLGVLAGYVLFGSDDANPDIVVAGDDDLTARQEQMVDLLDDCEAAWQAGDGDAVEAMFTDNGVLYVFGEEYRVDDARLAEYVDTHPFPGLEIFEPVLVRNDTLLSFHRLEGMGTFYDVIEFTSDGELLMISHEIVR